MCLPSWSLSHGKQAQLARVLRPPAAESWAGPPGRKLRLRELVIMPAFGDCCAVQSNITSENIIDGGEKKIQQFLLVS